MYVYCVYPAISKSQKQLPNCQQSETIVFLIVLVESYISKGNSEQSLKGKSKLISI